MQLTAKLVQLLPLVTGTSKNGDWKKQEFIVEGDGPYPKKICIAIWGDKIKEAALQLGNVLKIDFDIESREYNSRWFTDLKAWKVELVKAGMVGESDNKPERPKIKEEKEIEDDLPF
jgi:hypothetical protein